MHKLRQSEFIILSCLIMIAYPLKPEGHGIHTLPSPAGQISENFNQKFHQEYFYFLRWVTIANRADTLELKTLEIINLSLLINVNHSHQQAQLKMGMEKFVSESPF